MSYLFLAAIGPVQDFIATARRSRDLWFGSWMLSELARAGGEAIMGVNSARLIFPVITAAGQVTNRLLAIVEDPQETAGRVEKAIRERLRALRDEAFSHVKDDFDRALAQQQIDDLVEFYWVSVPFEGEEQYARARTQAEVLLAARKATRDFRPYHGQPRPKSSLDGWRESVIPEDKYPTATDSPSRRQQKIRHLYWAYGARRGERLSGVDLLKRLGRRGEAEEPKFRSTSHMAALPYLAMLRYRHGPTADQAIINEIVAMLVEKGVKPERGDMDGALLFESRVREWVEDARTMEDIRVRLRKILRRFGGEREPIPYYALILADGDFMGEVIDAQRTPDAHYGLSQRLSEFAERVEKIVAAHKGVLVYAGGDDVLAYLPLHTALACACELAATFRKHMDSAPFSGTGGRRLTLSAGMVIAHHLTPLSDVLEQVRATERAAKSWPDVSRPTKNALAITLSRRGGEERTVVGPWATLAPRLQRLISYIGRGAISMSAAYDLEALARDFPAPDARAWQAMAAEAVRIIQRKQERGGGAPLSADVVKDITDWIQNDRVTPDALAREMVIASTFAAAIEMAFGEVPEEGESPCTGGW